MAAGVALPAEVPRRIRLAGLLNTWSAAASGTLDLSTGASSTNVPLISDNYLTGNVAQPCLLLVVMALAACTGHVEDRTASTAPAASGPKISTSPR
jgi:hypothetical protein